MSAWQILQGVETLPLRGAPQPQRAGRGALSASPPARQLGHPGLPDHPQHALLKQQMRALDGVPMASACWPSASGGAAAGEKFIEGAQFMSHLVNIGDTRTLISHPATTTHRQLDEAQQLAAGVLPDMVRISVGLEHIDDILWDIDQALTRSAL